MQINPQESKATLKTLCSTNRSTTEEEEEEKIDPSYAKNKKLPKILEIF